MKRAGAAGDPRGGGGEFLYLDVTSAPAGCPRIARVECERVLAANYLAELSARIPGRGRCPNISGVREREGFHVPRFAALHRFERGLYVSMGAVCTFASAIYSTYPPHNTALKRITYGGETQ